MSASRGLHRLQRNCQIPIRAIGQPVQRLSRVTVQCVRQPTQHTLRWSSTQQHPERTNDFETDPPDAEDAEDIALEDQLLAVQNAAIAELEDRLGTSLESAVVNDQLAELVLTGQYAVDAAEDEIDISDPENEPLVQLRIAGASSHDVIREARNIFGDYLPENALSQEELTLYKRLYGEPAKERDQEGEDQEDDGLGQEPEHALYTSEGQQIRYRLENQNEIADSMQELADADRPSVQAGFEPMLATRAADVATQLGGELVDEEGYEEDFDETDDSAIDTRAHPLTNLGRFRTSPKTVFFPQETFVHPVQAVMKNYSNKQLKELAEKTFGGAGLPDSPLTPKIGRSRQQVPIPLEAGQHSMGQMEANVFITTVMPPTYAAALSTMVETRKRLGASWLNRLMAKTDGPRVLDVGSGGVGALAWKDTIKAHWESLHSADSNTPPVPQSKLVVLTGSDTLRHRAASMLENTTFIPRLPDYIQTRQTPTLEDDRPAQQRKKFDVIIASHSMFPLREEWERKQHIQNLWSLLEDDGGVLILIEKGIPRGFETVAAARELLLEKYIAVPEGQTTYYSDQDADIDSANIDDQRQPGMIIAPCTNHEQCPLYKVSGISQGRRDICSFQQRYIRPPFLQRILGARDRNHDDVDFSYLAVMKGDDLRARTFTTWDHVQDPLSAPRATISAETAKSIAAQERNADDVQKGFEHTDPTWSDSVPPPPAHTLPRLIYEPIKRHGHVTLDVCTPQAEIRRWTIPKSFSRQAYRDARKARWGDLWALGAKTNISRNIKVGVSQREVEQSAGMKGNIGKPKNRKERLERQAQRIAEEEHEQRLEERAEQEELWTVMNEEAAMDEVEGDDGLIDMDTLLPRKTKRQNHAKIDGVNIAGKATPQKPSPLSSQTRNAPQRAQQIRSARSKVEDFSPEDAIDKFDYTPGRYTQPDALSEWSESLDDAALEDEARQGVQRSGRRATQKNTYRFKKELRRARRSGAE